MESACRQFHSPCVDGTAADLPASTDEGSLPCGRVSLQGRARWVYDIIVRTGCQGSMGR